MTLFCFGCAFKGRVELAQALVALEQMRQAETHDGVAIVLGEIVEDFRLGEGRALAPAGLGDLGGGVFLALAGPRDGAVETGGAAGPVLAQAVGLANAEGRELVVIVGQERSLPVPREDKPAHG